MGTIQDRRRKFLLRLICGREEDPRWARPGLLLLLFTAAVAYTWALDASGYGNEYYAAAAYSGSQSWTAWFFGSFDGASFISVDKPPVSLWVTGMSIRMFGLSSWSVLLPHVVAGVATIGILYGTVRRWHGHAAGLLAAAALAVTPIAAVMFRYNNPDAVLTLLMVSALAVAHAAARRGSGWRLAGAGALVGLAFLTKTTQALLIIPGIAIAYLVMAPISLRRRIIHGLGAGLAAIASAGWWIMIADASPAAPYFGQTSTGSFIDYVLGVNGFDRVTGSDLGVGGPGRLGGSTGWSRLFNEEIGDQVAWLIPLAVAGLVVGVWRCRSDSRTESIHTGWLMWGTVFVTHFVVFSHMHGPFHPYYSVSMAPAIGALAAAGAVDMWRARGESHPSRWLLPVVVVVSAVWAWGLLARSSEFAPWLGPVIFFGSLAGSVALVAGFCEVRWSLRVGGVVGALLIVVSLAGPASFALASIGADYSGGDPRAGPVAGETRLLSIDGQASGPLPTAGSTGGAPPPDAIFGPPNRPGYPGQAENGLPRQGGDGSPGVGGPSLSDKIVDFLVVHHDSETWLVATIGIQAAAKIILETGEPVMAMGGFSGGDPTPTVDELVDYIGSGALRFAWLGGARNSPKWAEWERIIKDLCVPVDLGGSPVPLFDCAV